MKLNEAQRIDILRMIGYGDMQRTHEEVCYWFNRKYRNQTICQSTVCRIERKFLQLGHVRDPPRSSRPPISDEKKIDLLLSLQDNQHVTCKELARNLDVATGSVVKILHTNKYHPYKMQVHQELSDGD